MVRHNVFFWLDETLRSDDRQTFEKGLQALFEIDVVSAGSFGKSAATPERPVTQNSYDYALFLEFDNVEKHNAYQVHAEHDVFVEKFSKWFKQVRVYDTEMS